MEELMNILRENNEAHVFFTTFHCNIMYSNIEEDLINICGNGIYNMFKELIDYYDEDEDMFINVPFGLFLNIINTRCLSINYVS